MEIPGLRFTPPGMTVVGMGMTYYKPRHSRLDLESHEFWAREILNQVQDDEQLGSGW